MSKRERDATKLPLPLYAGWQKRWSGLAQEQRGRKQLPQPMTPVSVRTAPPARAASRHPPVPPRLRVLPTRATHRSPEAGGELARGFQTGVPTGGDFVLGANLPARRVVGLLKRGEKEKERR